MIDSNRGVGRSLVAVDASYRLVTSSKREIGFLVFGQRVTGGLESQAGMALLTTISPRVTRKLALMLILMTIDTERKLDSVTRRAAGRNMARGALDCCMRRNEGKAGLGMIRCGIA